MPTWPQVVRREVLLGHSVNHNEDLRDCSVLLPNGDVIGQGGHRLSDLAELALQQETAPSHTTTT